MSNLFQKTSSNWIRYDKYEWKEDKEGTLYIIPSPDAKVSLYNQADHNSENMGLTTWKNAPDGRIFKSDTPIAKKTIWAKNRFVNWNVLLQGILIT